MPILFINIKNSKKAILLPSETEINYIQFMIMYHSGQSLWWTIFYSVKYLGIRARPPRAATRPTPTRPRRSPRLPTRALKAKILPQSVGIRFVHCRLCPPGVISQFIAVPPKFSN